MMIAAHALHLQASTRAMCHSGVHGELRRTWSTPAPWVKVAGPC